MSALERKYTVLGVAAAIGLAMLILGYRVLQSDADQVRDTGGGMANHHSKTLRDPLAGAP